MITYRHAKLSDIEDIIQIVNHFADKGLMLPRTRSALYEGIREIIIAVEDGEIIATGALHVIWDDLAEIKTLAVNENYQRRGIGRKIVELLLDEARQLECPRAFTLTYQVDFFSRLGFILVDKDDLPHKVWKECINCVKFPNCDENAMILDLKVAEEIDD